MNLTANSRPVDFSTHRFTSPNFPLHRPITHQILSVKTNQQIYLQLLFETYKLVKITLRRFVEAVSTRLWCQHVSIIY